MVRFWQTVLLNEHTYQGSPFAPHADLPLEKEHFERWLALFYDNIDVHFTGEKVIEAKWRAAKMAEMFKNKIYKKIEILTKNSSIVYIYRSITC